MSEKVEPIDKYNLDTACMEQVQLFQDAADRASDLAELRDLAKITMETIYAELDGKIRKEGVEKGEKITDKSIEAIINRNPDYIEAKKSYIEARTKASKANNEKSGYKERKSLLEYMIRLYLSSYYSDVETRPEVLSRKMGAEKIKKELYKNKEKT